MKMCSVLVPRVCLLQEYLGLVRDDSLVCACFPSHVEKPKFREKSVLSLGWFRAVASQKLQMLK